MAISSIGSSHTYVYHVNTGRLATKDGSEDDFVRYFNGDATDVPDTCNGFDQAKKSGINNMLMLLQEGKLKAAGTHGGPDGETYEITSDIEDAVTTHFSINGKRVLTSYDAGIFSCIGPTAAQGMLQELREKLYKEVQMHGTKQEVRSGESGKAGRPFAIPDAVYQEALKKYEEFLSTPVSQKFKMKA